MLPDKVNCCSPEVRALGERSQAIKDFYDSVARNEGPYNEKTDKFSPSAPTEKIKSLAEELKAQSVLDIGCGMGTTLFSLAKIVPQARLIGIDFSENMVDRARMLKSEISDAARVGFFTADAARLPYMNAEFDFVYSECVFTLLEDRAKGFREVGRVLRPGGTFVYTDFVSTKDVPSAIREDLSLVSGCRAGAWTLDRTVELLRSSGFSSTDVIDFTEDKNARYRELMQSSEEIAAEYIEFSNRSPESRVFLEEHVNYVAIICKR